MPRYFEEISVHCLARTKVDRDAVDVWLKELGATEFEVPPAHDVADPALLVALAAKQCYMAFQPGLNPNVSKVRSDLVQYLDNILAQKHGSVLTHAVFTFAINGCSRVFTGEMNRHAVGVGISERSMRFIRYDEITYWMPECFRDVPTDTPRMRAKKEASRTVLDCSFEYQEEMMKKFGEIWAEELSPDSTFHGKKVLTSAFRRGIGMGIATGGVWSMNLRALRHIIAVRTDEGAEEEIAHVMRKVGNFMIDELPELFGDFEETESGALVPKYAKV